MKCLAILLLSIAAANAASFTYEYYCAHNFYVYPSSQCYNYHVYCPSTWCSSSYYTPILKVYPGDDCTNADWQETAPATIMSEVRNLLNSALSKMTSQMYAKRNQFIAKVDSVHAEYKAYYKKYLTQFYTYRFKCGYLVGINYVKERDAKIAEYCAALDKTRKDIYTKYTNAIAEKIKAIKTYHDNLVKKGTECLNTRLTKVTDYKKTMIQKAYDATVKFGKLHLTMLKQNKDFYQNALTVAMNHDSSFFSKVKASVSVATYYSKQRLEVERWLRTYAFKLASHYKKMIKLYTCAYKCYMSNSCLRFYSKSYQTYCKTTHFSCKSDYKVKKMCISPFKFNYKSCTYGKLCTCDVNQDAKNNKKVIDDMTKKMNDVLAANTSKYNAWKSQWVGYFRAYKQAYEKIVRCRHTWYLGYLRKQYIVCNGYLLAVNISSLAKLKAELEQKLKELCDKYNQQLDAKIVAADQAHAANQAAYKKAMQDLIAKLSAKSADCLAKRTVAINDYQKKLIAKRDALRADLVAKLTKVKNAHFDAFNKMLVFYHGTNYKSVSAYNCLYSRYVSVINAKVNTIISNFDSHWRSLIPRLVTHYSCKHRCIIKACTSSYHCGGFYSWSYKLPVSSCYGYQYGLYVSCH